LHVTFRRWVLLILLVVAMLAFAYRQQIYVRDFKGSVMRNGVKEDGVQVFFNVTDDALLMNDNSPMYMTLLQHDLPVRSPAQINCVHFFVCFIAKDGATLAGSESGSWIKSMTNSKIEFRDDEKRDAIVTF
jgi:hypothetical protein